MTYRQELIDIKGIGAKIADKIIDYAFTKEVLIQKLTNNYQEMIDKFRDDVVKKLALEFIRAENVEIPMEEQDNNLPELKPGEAIKDDTPKENKQDDEKTFDKTSLSRFIQVSKDRIQYDCPICQTHIQVSIEDKCPVCGHKL